MADILRRLWLLSLGMKKNLSDSNRLTRVAAAVVLWILSFIVSKSPLKIIFRRRGFLPRQVPPWRRPVPD